MLKREADDVGLATYYDSARSIDEIRAALCASPEATRRGLACDRVSPDLLASPWFVGGVALAAVLVMRG